MRLACNWSNTVSSMQIALRARNAGRPITFNRKTKNMLRKNIYKWHRTASLIVSVPVLLWALSGFMHPIMTTIRPKLATQFLQPAVIDSSKIKMPLELALRENHIDSFVSFRIVHIEDNWFYQVQATRHSEPVYLATLNGKLLTAGNWLYAQYLAKQFLEARPKDSAQQTAETGGTMATHDCCDAATNCVVNSKSGAKITDASLISAYNNEYKKINRLLPVYRVSFNRPDGIRIYVDPLTDRFAFAMDNKRRAFDNVFTLLHTWGWLDFLRKGKLIAELLLVSLAFATTVLGVYIFFTTHSKKANGNRLAGARRWHRYTSITVALFTLMFTFSGAYHALAKLGNDRVTTYVSTPAYHAKNIRFDLTQLAAGAKAAVLNVGIVTMNGEEYWRLQVKTTTQPVRKDQLKDTASMPSTLYVSTQNNKILQQGEMIYAKWLAAQFSGQPVNAILSVTPITRFGAEYTFADKRLPVWKIQYGTHYNERFFVETATGCLAKQTNDIDLLEGYSFGFLHKHEFLGWAGKGWKDFSTMFWAMAQVLMVVLGLILYSRWRGRKKIAKR